MTVITLPQRASPSWQTGFARYAGESLYPNLWNGVVGAWVPALGPTGSTLRDVSGRGNHGTLTDMDPATDWVVGEKGYALDFDGSNDYISINSSDSIKSATGEGQPRTISLWMKHTTTANTVVTEKGENADFVLQTSGGASVGKVQFRVGGTSAFNAISTVTINDGNWHHVVGVHTGENYIYVDGVDVSTSNPTQTAPADNANPLVIGSRLGAYGYPGRIANVLIYARALTPNEIQQLYADPLGMFRRRRLFPVSAGAAPPSFAGRNLILGGGVI